MSRTVRSRWSWTLVSLAVVVGGTSLGAASAEAAPSDVVVASPLQPAGTPLAVTGAGCTGEVAVRVVTWLAGAPEVLEQVPATPAADGSWSATVRTPSRAAAVEASCDGVDGLPVPVGATDGEVTGGFGPTATTPAAFVIASEGPLLEDSLLQVWSEDGTTLLGQDVAVGGSAEVSLPRALGPGRVLVLAVRGDGGAVLPQLYAVALGPATDVTVAAAPRVGPAGEAVTVSGGGCPGQVGISVAGHSTDWYDPPTHYPGASLTGEADGTWSVVLTRPPEVARLRMTCTVAGLSRGAGLVLGVTDGASVATTVIPSGAERLVRLPVGSTPLDVEAFAFDGTPVPVTSTDDPYTYVVPAGAPRILLLGVIDFGENAESLVSQTPEQFLAVLDEVPPTPPAPGPGAGAGQGPTPELADSGPSTTWPALASAGLLVLAGAALRAASGSWRRPDGPRAPA